jgi:unspecific monooxygenase
MGTSTMKRRAVAAAGRAAALVPLDSAQLFAFVASPAVRTEPWSLYARLHARGPVRPSPYPGVWLVAAHAEADRILRSAGTSVDESRASAFGAVDRTDPFMQLVGRSLLFLDAPDHTRLRRLVARAFTPRTVEALRPRVEEMVDAALSRLRPAGAGDLLAEIALPLPVAVICELLGVPERERERFLGWARHLAPRLDLDLFRDEARNRAGNQASVELAAFLNELVDDPSRRDPDGLLSELVAVEDDGDRLTRDEVIAMAVLLLVAGFETTTNLIANGVLALLRHPDQLARVREGDVDAVVAVDELLRFAGPVQFTQRVLLQDTTVGGQDVPAGALLALLIGAANRDPHVFAEPDVLDVGRRPNPHLSFSAGAHHCLGASLARLEAAVTIPAILRALPDLGLAGRPRWRDTFVLRGLTALPVTWRPC